MSEPELDAELADEDSDFESASSSEGQVETAQVVGDVKEEEQEKEDEEIEESPEEEEPEEEEGPIVYDPNDFISRPSLGKKSTFKEDDIKIHHSFGYDCQKLYNLCHVDHNNVAFVSGNYIHIFNVSNYECRLKRSAGGSGLGFIARHPTQPLLAVGEKGINPLIIVYAWPTFEVVSVLRNGTKREYTYLHFSPDGELLASQGGPPDYVVTVWKWRMAKPFLKCKAHGQDIFRVQFSPYLPGHLTSCGIGHIKFWQMSDTFTGQKLQGIVGKFGKTEICDITTLCQMPDEKVISDCVWGNILIWDAEVIRLEVQRRNGEPCHSQPITWLEYNANNDELLSVGLDGKFKIWNYTTIDTADPPDDNRVVQMQASYEYEIKDGEGIAAIRTIFRRNPTQDPYHFVAQDLNGFIWLLDLEVKPKPDRPVRLFRCHAGSVVDIAASPCEYYIATIGVDGNLHVYNAMKKSLLMYKKLTPLPTALLWLPLESDRTGTMLIVGYCDGTLRGVILSIKAREQNPTDSSQAYINVIWAIKPHTDAIRILIIDISSTMVISGSDDHTLFAYKLVLFREYLKLLPLCQVKLRGPISSITWKKRDEKPVVLVTCINGYVAECQLLDKLGKEPIVSYNYNLPIRRSKFRSVKSETQRNEKALQIKLRKDAKLEKKKAELKKLYAENPGVIINEELYLEDSEEEEELPPLYVPRDKSPIYFARSELKARDDRLCYIDKNHVWVSAGAYDAGYMYNYKLGKNHPVKAIPMSDADGTELRLCHELFNGEYLIFGLNGGKIRLVRINSKDYTDLSDYWELAVHDPSKNFINRIALSYDSRMMYTVGEDSNIISYYINIPDGKYGEKKMFPPPLPPPEFGVSDYIAPDALSIEQIKKGIQAEKQSKIHEKTKDKLKARVNRLRTKFSQLVELNDSLPDIYRIPRSKFPRHPRVVAKVNELINQQKDLLKRQALYDFLKSKLLYKKLHDYFVKPVKVFYFTLTGIRISDTISSYSRLKVNYEFLEAENAVKKYLILKERRGRIGMKQTNSKEDGDSGQDVQEEPKGPTEQKVQNSNSKMNFYPHGVTIHGLHEVLPLLKPQEMIEYMQFEKDEMDRAKNINELDMLIASKPDKCTIEKELKKAVDEMSSRGMDFKLKISPDYRVPRKKRVTKEDKYANLLELQRKIWKVKDDFNQKILNLRETKVQMVVSMKTMRAQLKSIHREIGPDYAKPFPPIPFFNMTKEFPERLLDPYADTFPPDEPIPKQELDAEFKMLYGRKPWDPSKARGKLYLPNQLKMIAKGDAESQLPTEWSEELTQLRLLRLREKQDLILYKANAMVENYDEGIVKLKILKLKCQMQLVLLEYQFLIVEEELEIIRGFQVLIEKSQKKIDVNVALKHVTILRVNIKYKKIKRNEEHIEISHRHIKDIQNEFNITVLETKYAKPLSKTFKKKYRPPRRDDEDEYESSSSDDSSTTDSDTMDESGVDIGGVVFDENVCPDDLDPNIYQYVFVLRAMKYREELRIVTLKKEIVELQKQIQVLKKKLVIIEVVMAFQYGEIDNCLRQQHKKLSKLEIMVLLKTSQLQNYDIQENKYAPGEECVVISGKTLFDLIKRKAEYEEEIKNSKEKERDSEEHLKRLKKDIQYMKKETEKIKELTKQKMKTKFGAVVDMRLMNIHLIREMLVDRKYAHLEAELNKEKDKLASKRMLAENKRKMMEAMRENTNKLYTLSGLLEQTRAQTDLIHKQKIEMKKGKKKGTYIPDEELDADIEQLTKILEEQKAIKNSLLSKIVRLKLNSESKYTIPIEQAPTAPDIDGAPKHRSETEQLMITVAKKEADTTSAGIKSKTPEDDSKGSTSPTVLQEEQKEDTDNGEETAEELAKDVMMSVIKEVFPTPHTSGTELDVDMMGREIMSSIMKKVLPTPESSKSAVEIEHELDEAGEMMEKTFKESEEMTKEIFKEVLEHTLKLVIPSEETLVHSDEELEQPDLGETMEGEGDIWTDDEEMDFMVEINHEDDGDEVDEIEGEGDEVDEIEGDRDEVDEYENDEGYEYEGEDNENEDEGDENEDNTDEGN